MMKTLYEIAAEYAEQSRIEFAIQHPFYVTVSVFTDEIDDDGEDIWWTKNVYFKSADEARAFCAKNHLNPRLIHKTLKQ